MKPEINSSPSFSNDNAAPSIASGAPLDAPLDTRTWGTNPLTLRRDDVGDQTILRLAGSFDAISTPEVRSTLDAVVSDRRARVAIDLSALRLIDSSGVGAVVSLYKRVREQGGSVRLEGLRGQPLAILRLLGLDRVLAA